jgi:HSP20 family protein
MLTRRLLSFPGWSSPFRELDELRREMDRVFGSLSEGTGFGAAGVFPAINVSETNDAVFVKAELPGMKSDDLDVTFENGTVTLSGEREAEEESGDVSYHRRERQWGSFRRSFSIPQRIDADGVRARYLDGILTVELPKAAEARPKQIAIQAGK